MKQFLNPKAISLELENMEGEKKAYQVKNITRKMQKEIKKIVDSDVEDQAYQQMAILCGGKAEDYEAYDIRLLSNVLVYITEQIQNPT